MPVSALTPCSPALPFLWHQSLSKILRGEGGKRQQLAFSEAPESAWETPEPHQSMEAGIGSYRLPSGLHLRGKALIDKPVLAIPSSTSPNPLRDK